MTQIFVSRNNDIVNHNQNNQYVLLEESIHLNAKII